MRVYGRICWAVISVAVSKLAFTSAETSSSPLSVFSSLTDDYGPAPTAVEIDKDFFSEPTEDSNLFYSELHPCPRACGKKHADEWDLFTSVSRLKLCLEPMLVDVALYNPLDASHTVTTLRACTQGNAETRVNAAFTASKSTGPDEESALKYQSPLSRRFAMECVAGESKAAGLSLSISDSNDRSTAGHWAATTTLLGHISAFFKERSNCHYKTLFGYLNGTVIGVYVGHSINAGSLQTVVEAVQTSLASDAVSNITAEICNKGHGGDHVVGLTVLTDGDLATVQTRLRAWDKADCTEPNTSAREIKVHIMAEPFQSLNHTVVNSTVSNFPVQYNATGERILPRGECRTQPVVKLDDCEKLAAKCGISLSDFKKYNPQKGLCTPTGLFEGMDVCCSSGSLPDRTQKPDKDGNCASYYVIPDDNCPKIAMKYGITPKDLEEFNTGRKGTWGWAGCESLNAYLNICVSEGHPPMPAPIPNAVCGPVKPGSTPGKKSLAEMNPCPLNACCNVWGNCGLSNDFCLDERGPTGNPGTSPENQWGCISNCGMEIVSSDAPAAYGRVGYYESWNFDRGCLYLQAKSANTDGSYTIIHWAFMEIDTETWTPRVKDPHNQWQGFKSLADVQKVISFGGWGYSTEPETYDILRQAMSPANRGIFVGNINKFLIEEDLDGVDFDWEYPGATDIDGTPPGTPEDGKNYLQFLVLMSERLWKQPPHHFTLSIAAPASFWYLKAFPIKQMARYLDYIVFMTYDLHGQWDAGNQWTSEGCPGGNCLRSHVNLTETVTALAMITKAGVPSNKIYVGEASYGRSFKMSQAGCDGPDCTFEGDRYHSQAAKGICTDTAGYISHAEIAQIIGGDATAKVWHDGPSNSDLLVYDETEWVAYMTPVTKGTRRDFWKGKNFAGTIDWAVDLMDYHQSDEAYGLGNDDRGEFDGKTTGTTPCKEIYTSLEDIEKDKDKLEMHCRDEYILSVLKTGLKDAISEHDELINGRYDHNFDLYAGAMADNVKKTVKDFMYKKGADFFSCTVTETVDSCEHCNSALFGDSDERYCRYCEDFDCKYRSTMCVHMPPCGGDHKVRFREMPMACPPDFSGRSTDPDKNNLIKSSTKWTMSDGMEDAFYAQLLAETAVPSDKVVWEDVRWSPAQGSRKKHKDDPMYMDYNFPNPKNFKKSDVPNPKDVIDEGREKLNSIISSIDDVFEKIQEQTYGGLVGDLVDALAIPIVMAQQSVVNMKMANDIGKKIDDEKKKQFIVLFLTAILFFIPFVGEVAGTIGALAGVARFLIILGDVGSLGMDVYSMVDSKGKDPFAIVGMIMAPLALLDVGRIAAAATLRRGMKDVDLQTMGKEAKATLDAIERIKGRQTCPINKRNLALMELPWTSDMEMSSLNIQPIMSGWL